MRVYMGPYKRYFGTYKLVQLIPFLSEETRDKLDDYLHPTWVGKLLDWINEKRGDRKIKVHIDQYDTWSADDTLARIALPLLQQLKEQKHGSPCTDLEDAPERLRYGNEEGSDNWVHYRWEWILGEMIYAMNGIVNQTEIEETFYVGEPKLERDEEEYVEDVGLCFHMKQTNPDYRYKKEEAEAHYARVDNGLRLFGKYFRHLWS